MAGSIKGITVAVSYTHLDVYKRKHVYKRQLQTEYDRHYGDLPENEAGTRSGFNYHRLSPVNKAHGT